MRIISGKLKGRRLMAPKNLPVRPTTDMAKEALFNILENRYYLDELEVLDLFSGTGNIAFEFASRGCTDITAVDRHYPCIKFINEVSLEFDLGIKTIKADVFAFLDALNKQRYDIIFADPPYDIDLSHFERLVTSIRDKQLLSEEGLCIVEHSKHTSLSHVEGFQMQKKYGGNCFSFFK
ncbi:RsmD family RNA methyltransferase [Winogradskyella aurantiaca]|uniref:RsmD family RNA methyltransferase n=1 Tax=Winogradskyella aurantiaca TaxID=2219558 RepID=UPI000E1D4019|nr:RsmD family RNA methyltransferase [Winogradskyella aurantiaca]